MPAARHSSFCAKIIVNSRDDEEKNCSYLEREERKTVELSKLHEIEMFAVMILMNEYGEAFRPITPELNYRPQL